MCALLAELDQLHCTVAYRLPNCRMCAQVSLMPHSFAGRAVLLFSMVGRSPLGLTSVGLATYSKYVLKRSGAATAMQVTRGARAVNTVGPGFSRGGQRE